MHLMFDDKTSHIEYQDEGKLHETILDSRRSVYRIGARSQTPAELSHRDYRPDQVLQQPKRNRFAETRSTVLWSGCAASKLAAFVQAQRDGLTVHDNNTGLTWQRSPDTDGDGALTWRDKLTQAQAQALPAKLNAAKFGGFSDWRLPTIKELYSLIIFSGIDPSGPGAESAKLTPVIDTKSVVPGLENLRFSRRLPGPLPQRVREN